MAGSAKSSSGSTPSEGSGSSSSGCCNPDSITVSFTDPDSGSGSEQFFRNDDDCSYGLGIDSSYGAWYNFDDERWEVRVDEYGIGGENLRASFDTLDDCDPVGSYVPNFDDGGFVDIVVVTP